MRTAPVAAPAGEPSAGPDGRELLAWHVIRLAMRVRSATSQRFRRMFNMSMVEWVIITYLAADAPISLTALARGASLDTQRTSLAVAQLAKRDLVSRTKNPDNGREAAVALTPRGRAVFNAIIENWLNKELAHGFNEAELAAANDLLQRLTVRAEQILAREQKDMT
jgi:DNA-binding MarR family transcriptional regulator